MPTVAELAQQELDKRRVQQVSAFQASYNPFNPNFRATVGSKLRELIDDSGIGGGYKQGLINAGNTIEAGIDFTPIVGDAVGVGDIRTSYNQGDMLGTGINTVAAAVGALPIVGDVAAKGVKSALRGLDMTPDARMQRAAEQGYEGGIFHGSTYDIDQFDPNKTNTDNYFGQGIYTTTSPRDAYMNYAGEGPDLTNRIQRRAEELEDNQGLNPEDALQMARSELKGGNQGVIYPLMGRTTKAFDISNDGDTFLRYEAPELDPEDYLDDAGGDMDLAIEMAQEASYDFPMEGELVDFFDSLQRNPNLNENDFSTLQQNIVEEAFDGGLSAKRLDEIFRESDIYPEDEAGNLMNYDVFRKAIQDSGYDTIIHQGDIFQGMFTSPDTKHKIFLDPTRLRSINAEFDPEKMDSADLLSSVGTTSALRGVA